MRRHAKTRSELMAILNQCLNNDPECGECELHAMRVHRPDHTGCNWSAEVDFPCSAEEAVSAQLRAARSIIVDMRQHFNVLQ